MIDLYLEPKYIRKRDRQLRTDDTAFTNTDITSHICFLDTLTTTKIKVIRADTKEEELFSSHPNAKDKWIVWILIDVSKICYNKIKRSKNDYYHKNR